MADLKLNLSIKEENSQMFKRCVRKLFDSTFIVGEKDERLFSFVSRESNRQDIADYLRMIGLDLIVDNNVRIAMMIPYDSDEEAVGLKRANVITFTNEQYHILLVLWEIYLENLGFSNENVVSKGDFIDKLKAYGAELDKKDLSVALKLFKKYDLIDYDIKDTSEDAMISLYPSLQFGWDLAQFRTVADEYLHSNTDDDSQEDVEGESEE